MDVNVKVTIDLSDRVMALLAVEAEGRGTGLPEHEARGTGLPKREARGTCDKNETETAEGRGNSEAAMEMMIGPVVKGEPIVEQKGEPIEEPNGKPGDEGVYKETPEMALQILRERYGIPDSREERNEEQQRMVKALNSGVISVIREVTKNNMAKKLSDLKTEEQKTAFIKMALEDLKYNTNSGKFEILPF